MAAHGLGRRARVSEFLPFIVRRLWLLLACALLLFVQSVPFAQAATRVAGDLAPRGSADHRLNAGDLVVLQRMILGLITPTPEELKIGDVAPVGAPDKVLNAADLVVLTRAVLGQITLPPVYIGPDPPTLNSIAATTTTNPFVISGSTAPNVSVRLYVNNVYQAVTQSSAIDGSFNFKAALYDGANSIYATVWDGSNESVPSNLLSTTYTNSVSRTQSNKTISADTVWTPGSTNTPYTVTGTLTVAAGATLTLQTGTQLKFSAGAKLLVNGSLVIRGTAASMVIFTSAGTLAPQAWVGIEVASTATRVVIDGADIEYADKGVYFNGTTVLDSGDCAALCVKNSLIQNNNTGIYTTTSSPRIVGNTIQNNSYGIEVDLISNPVITGGNVITANGGGIWVVGYGGAGGRPRVNGNSIYGNSYNYYAAGFTSNGTANNVVLDAKNNWWGTNDPFTIRYLVSRWSPWDTDIPVIDFSGYLQSAGGAPTPGNFLIGPVQVDALAANTTYVVLETLRVPAGKTLTIPSGVTLQFINGVDLLVEGSLVVNGTQAAPVTFTSSQTPVSRGNWAGINVASTALRVVIDGAVFEGAGQGVYFNGTTAVDAGDCLTLCVKNSLFRNNTVAITVSASSPRIVGNTLQGNGAGSTGIYANGNAVITGNTIAANGTGIVANSASSPWISSNQITANVISGIEVDAPSGAIITGNNISGSGGNGIYFDDSYSIGGLPTASGNTIHDNYYGIHLHGAASPLISGGNIITANAVGIFVEFPSGGYGIATGPVINGNSIYGNPSYSYYVLKTTFNSNTGITVLNAKNNWWGSADVDVIHAGLYDYGNDPVYLPVVDFSGYLQSAGGAPTPGNFLLGPVLQVGVLTANTTYIVLDDLIVNSGSTLTIPQGVTLQFGNFNQLLVKGTLLVQGVPTAPVTFTSYPGKGYIDWQGIVVASTAARVVIDGAVIEWAVEGVWFNGTTAVDAPSCTVLCIRNSIIQNDDVGVMVSGNSAPTLTANTIYANESDGIYLLGSGYDSTSPRPVITSNDIYQNVSAGVSVANYSSSSSLIINATNNWWGVPVPAVGSQIVYASSPIVVNAGSPSTQPLRTATLTGPANGAAFYLPDTITLAATSTASNATVSKVDFYNGASLLGTATTPPYSYMWNGVATGVYTITARVTYNGGAVSITAPATVSVKPITLTIDAGIDGSVVNDDHMLVSGTFDAPPNTGVVVNGVLAVTFQRRLSLSNLFYANNVPLTSGSNTLTVSLVSQNGQTATTSATVTSTGPAGFSIIAQQDEGVAPFSTQFTYTNNTNQAVKTLQLDLDGNGTIDYMLSNPQSGTTISVNYPTAGIYQTKMTLRDTNYVVLYASTQSIMATTTASRDALLRPIVTGMFYQLSNGNIQSALTAVTPDKYSTYSDIFTSLGTALPAAANGIGTLQNGIVAEGSAEYTLLRDSSMSAYMIDLVRCADGVWRIDGM